MARVRGNAVLVAYDAIVEKIHSCALASGDVVSDLELSRELDMSRTPIREAMLRLIDYGVLERTATKVIVKPITPQDIVEIYQVRQAIEIMSVEIIHQRGGLTPEQAKELMEIHSLLEQDITSGNYENSFVSDNAFHETLVGLSQNTRLIDICIKLNTQTSRLRWISLLTPYRHDQTRAEHQAIVEALIAGDHKATQEALRGHIQNAISNNQTILGNKRWSKLLQELNHMSGQPDIQP